MDSGTVSFPESISKKEFFQELARAKQFVDNGIRDYFILADTSSFKNNSHIGNTTLRDIENVYGKGYIELFRFAIKGDKDTKDSYETYSVRRLSKSDKRALRKDIRFFPPDSWVIDWRDATNHHILVPFIQRESGEMDFLCDNPFYRKDGKQWGRFSDLGNAYWWKKAVEDMPDYADCLFAAVSYKHTEILIPIPKDSAKKTFAKRDKDPDGITHRLIHEVRQHDRNSSSGISQVKSHLRGTGLLTIDGVDVTLIASWDWSKRYIRDLLRNDNQSPKCALKTTGV